jgi:uncharacterized membrane protein YccC
VTTVTQTASSSTYIASRRILRLTLGTTLSMGFAMAINWPMAFIASVFTMFLLSVPLPVPSLKNGIRFVLALVLPAYAGLILLPFLEHARWAGILMVILALFGSFYYTARGGSRIMGMFMTIGITMVVTVGSVSADIMILAVNGIAIGASVGVCFVYLAHALLPDLASSQPAGSGPKPTPPPQPEKVTANRNALRSLVVVLPLVFNLLFSSSSISYTAVMIKVASMGQPATSEISRSMGRDQLESTLWGGIGALVAWQVMSIWPSLLMFCLLIALASLLYGARIFKGPGMHPKAGMWTYALLTMIILITPAVGDSHGGSSAEAAFYTRLMLFVVIAIYGTVSVAVFDTFWPDRRGGLTGHAPSN